MWYGRAACVRSSIIARSFKSSTRPLCADTTEIGSMEAFRTRHRREHAIWAFHPAIRALLPRNGRDPLRVPGTGLVHQGAPERSRSCSVLDAPLCAFGTKSPLRSALACVSDIWSGFQDRAVRRLGSPKQICLRLVRLAAYRRKDKAV